MYTNEQPNDDPSLNRGSANKMNTNPAAGPPGAASQPGEPGAAAPLHAMSTPVPHHGGRMGRTGNGGHARQDTDSGKGSCRLPAAGVRENGPRENPLPFFSRASGAQSSQNSVRSPSCRT